MDKFLSVTQYGEKHGLCTGNIRRMIKSGRIPAVKIGNQWVIKADTPKPADLRVKSGAYVDWRKKYSRNGES